MCMPNKRDKNTPLNTTLFPVISDKYVNDISGLLNNSYKWMI